MKKIISSSAYRINGNVSNLNEEKEVLFMVNLKKALATILVITCLLTHICTVANASGFNKAQTVKYLKEQFENYSSSIDLSQLKIKKFDCPSLYDLIENDVPTSFNASDYTVYTSGGVYSRIDVSYRYTKSKYKSLLSQFKANTEYLLRGLRDGNLSEDMKALIIHDRLISWCEYDSINRGKAAFHSECSIAFGPIVNRSGICSGYTRAYNYLLNELGIRSEYISSDTLNHAWNLVTVNGKKYHVDVTWDDPLSNLAGNVSHDNFLRSTSGIKSTKHNTSDFDSSPTDTTYDNYFWRNSTSEFQYFNGAVYYIDFNNGHLIKRIGRKESIITTLDTKWYTPSGSYYTGCYSRLSGDGDCLYFTTPKAVYSLDTRDNIRLIDTPAVPANYNIYGLSVLNGSFCLYCCKTLDRTDSSDTCYKLSFRYAETCKLIYNYNNGDGSAFECTVKKGESIKVSDIEPVKEGMLFEGWSTNREAVSATYHSGDLITVNYDISLYAVYSSPDTQELSSTYEAGSQSESQQNFESTGRSSIILMLINLITLAMKLLSKLL